VSVNQIAFSGILVLAAVIAIFVLVTYRREPEHPRGPAY
jgi:multisubunit Na+/H+ antiporter MnhB subunit